MLLGTAALRIYMQEDTLRFAATALAMGTGT